MVVDDDESVAWREKEGRERKISPSSVRESAAEDAEDEEDGGGKSLQRQYHVSVTRNMTCPLLEPFDLQERL